MDNVIAGHVSRIADYERAIRDDAIEVVRRLPVDRPENWRTTISLAVKAGLSPRDLAEIGATSTSSISRWADGSSVPPITSRRWIQNELCKEFGVANLADEHSGVDEMSAAAE
ncbi:MAG: hypothetical protein ABTQ29_14720 [Siculibacillus sp.]